MSVLKKVLIGLAVVVIIGAGAVGFEAYRLYSATCSILCQPQPTAPQCTDQALGGVNAYPKLLPWTAASTRVRPRSTPLPGEKLKLCLDRPQDPSLSGHKRINILLLGTDNDCKFKGAPILTQTVFVVTIDPVHKKVGMLSIPRDSYVDIPGVGFAKMDEAFSDGEQSSTSTNPDKVFQAGVTTAESTVEQNFGIPIKYYAWVGLNGFVKVIDTMHGVDVNAIHPLVDDNYPSDNPNDCYGHERVYIPSGPQYMDGEIALQYVRSRHADLLGDYGRGQRQLQLMVSLRPKIDSLGLTDFLTVQSIVNELHGYAKTDLQLGQIGSYISLAKSLNLNQIHKLVLTPPYYSTPTQLTLPDGEPYDVVELNWPAVNAAVAKMFAQIGTRTGHHNNRNRQVFVTPATAASDLMQVSGATVQPPNAGTPSYSGSLSGAIYFVAGGNVWRYTSSGAQQVTHTTAINSATITSNGHKVAYYRRWSQNNADVWTKNLQTGVTRQITNSRQGDGNIATPQDCGGTASLPYCAWVWNVNPVISPNGRTVIFESDAYKDVASPALTVNADCGTSPYNGGIDLALYAYNVRTRATSMETAPCYGAGGDTDARFDPLNPNLILYTEYYYLNNSSRVGSRLVVLNLANGNRRRISPLRGNNMQGVWSPNSREVAWLGSSSQSTSLYIAPYSDGRLHRGLRRLVDSGLISEPAFSPDGKHLVYYKLAGSSFQMWIANLRKGSLVGHPERLMSQANMVASAPITWIK